MGVLFAAAAISAAGTGRADDCLQDAWDDGSVQSTVLFPNWVGVKAMGAGVWLYATGGSPENITGITVVNFGTAGSSDIKDIFVRFYCGATDSGRLTLTYAGMFPEDAGVLPAWTWAGSTVDFSGCADLCGNPKCGGYLNAEVLVDIAACPTAGATVRLGFPTNLGFSVGSISDNLGCMAPSGDAAGPVHTIQYVYKQGPDKAVPGDTVSFTLYYGMPGTSAISAVRIIDSLPPYTHYVAGSANPAPDVGWDPDVGPPLRLHWTLPGGSPAGGPTTMVTFDLTVDWGNEEWFEPGSGDTAAPEGARIQNEAHATYIGTNCAQTSAVSNKTETTVRRFLMWLLGDNDVLFSPTFGQPPDEMIYSVFVKNLSTTRTWWDVHLWDTVPAELDIWAPGYGVYDPCVGWTMTPTGCAPASPTILTPGGQTIMRWSLDMPPFATLEVRFKVKVKDTSLAGDNAVNVISLLELGRTAIVKGTGHSIDVKNFAHIAPIILPTTYVSYVSFGGDRWAQPDAGDALAMFPLNKKTQFELRGLTYDNGFGWGGAGGNSASIGCLLGDCIGGFPGSPGPCPTSPIPSGAGSISGCKTERIPARFHHAGPPLSKSGYQHLYKLTANTPVCWQSQPGLGVQCGDYMTYAPATTMTYQGLLHYFWRNSYHTNKGTGTALFYMNTGKDPYGTIDPDLTTIVHVFKFNYGSLAWDYRNTYELGAESGACDPTTVLGDEGAYRSVSSQAQLIVWQGYQALSTLGCGCPCYDNSTMMPTAETGNTVSEVGVGTFYGVIQGYGNTTKISLGNLGAVDATYRIYQYVPNTTVGPGEIPVNMRGTSGSWLFKGLDVTPAGFLAALNPSLYAEDGTFFDANSTVAFKVELVSGGPIQIHSGARVFAGWGGGSVLHASVPAASQTGSEFWVNQIHNNDGTDGASPQLFSISVFCAKTGMAVRMDTDDGRTETYTTNGVDQCISFIGFAEPARKRNIRVTRLPAVTGDVIAQYINAGPEKGYTAPFLVTGVHYSIITPPVVFIGQSIWITVVVLEQGGDTKTDYVGTTVFTSTDSAAKIEGVAMGSYTYPWVAGDAGVRIFINVQFNQLGLQSIIGLDTTDGSISGVTALMVVAADVKLFKRPQFVVASSGETVSFKVCWSNYSSGTAAKFVITDAVPQGMTYVPDLLSDSLCDFTSVSPPTLVPAGMAAYSTDTAGPMPADASFTETAGAPPVTTRWLRWTINQVNVLVTGCVCYRVRVD